MVGGGGSVFKVLHITVTFSKSIRINLIVSVVCSIDLTFLGDPCL